MPSKDPKVHLFRFSDLFESIRSYTNVSALPFRTGSTFPPTSHTSRILCWPFSLTRRGGDAMHRGRADMAGTKSYARAG